MQKEKAPKQLKLKFRYSLYNSFAKLKGKIWEWFRFYELHRYAKDIYVWINLSFSFSMTIFSALKISIIYSKLPLLIPIFNIYTDLERRLIQKEFIFSFPAISLVILVISYITSYYYYEKERYISYAILFLSSIYSLFIFLSLAKILVNA